MPNWIKNLFLVIALVAVVILSFWISFSIGQRMLSPIKKLPTRYLITAEAVAIPPAITFEVEEQKPVMKKELIKVEPLAKPTKPKVEIKTEPVAEKPVVKPETKGEWVIQSGLFASKTNAYNLVSSLKSKGFAAQVVKAGKYFRVYSESFLTPGEAKAHLSKIVGQGFEGVLRRK